MKLKQSSWASCPRSLRLWWGSDLSPGGLTLRVSSMLFPLQDSLWSHFRIFLGGSWVLSPRLLKTPHHSRTAVHQVIKALVINNRLPKNASTAWAFSHLWKWPCIISAGGRTLAQDSANLFSEGSESKPSGLCGPQGLYRRYSLWAPRSESIRGAQTRQERCRVHAELCVWTLRSESYDFHMQHPGEGKGYPLQYSGLENSMDCIVHGVTKSRDPVKEKATHSSILAWRIPQTV